MFTYLSDMQSSVRQSRTTEQLPTRPRSRSCDREIILPDHRPTTAADPPSVQLLFSDAAYSPPSFSGAANQDADRWLRRFRYYVDFRQMSDTAALQLFKLLLTDSAADWLESVPITDKLSIKTLYRAFKERFAASDIFRWQQASAIFARQQGATEAVDTYITDVLNLAKKVPIHDETLIRFALIKGFKPSVRQHVLQSAATTLQDTLKAARIAEAAAIQCPSESTEVATLSKDVRDLIAAFKDLQAKSRPSTPERVTNIDSRPRVIDRSPSPQPRRVTFEDSANRRPMSPRRPVSNTPMNWGWPDDSSPTPPVGKFDNFRRGQSADRWQPADRYTYNRQSTDQPWQTRQQSARQFRGKQLNSNFPQSFASSVCNNCGRSHQPGINFCPARGLRCFNCSRLNHMRRMCRSAPANAANFNPNYSPQQ